MCIAACSEKPAAEADLGGPGLRDVAAHGDAPTDTDASVSDETDSVERDATLSDTEDSWSQAPLTDDQRFFDPDRVIDVRVTLDPNDWEALAQQARSLSDILGEGCLDGPVTSPFTWFPADVVIDGFPIPAVGVRKKGFLGSLDPVFPSIKLKLDQYVDGQDLGGMTRMTLNNAKQDPSKLNQCLSYALFAAAGVPAPRCSYVHLHVNDKDMGVYVHVESIKKPFIQRHFPFDGGNLYEGALSDFRPDWVNTFSKKTNTSKPDRTDLDLVTTAAQAPDAVLLSELANAVDLDSFYAMWAVEVLVNHQDGYAQNSNNFYVYRRLDGRFTFIPWGTDGTMFWNADSGPFPAVKAHGHLARRLYLHPEGRTAFLDRLQALMDTIWDETQLLAEIDRQEQLVAPHVLAAQQLAFQQQVQVKRDFVQTHRARLQANIDVPPSWDFPERNPPCFTQRGAVDLTFDTTFGTLAEDNIFATGSATVDATIDDEAWAVPTVGSKAGAEPTDPETAQIVVAGFLDEVTTPGGIFFAVVALPTSFLSDGAVIPINWSQAFGQVARLPEGSEDAVPIGFMLEGTLTLEQAGSTPGSPIIGRIQSPIVQFGQ